MTASRRFCRAVRLMTSALVALHLAGCAAFAPTPPAVDGLQPPATVQNAAGATIPYRGTQSSEQTTILSRRSRNLAVLAFGAEREGGGTCGPQLLRVLARETASAVRVLIAWYEVPTDPNVQCSPLSGIPSPHVVRLARPLGDRAVLDARTGTTIPVLDGATVPTLGVGLTGWRQQPLDRDPEHHLVTRTWTRGSGRALATVRLTLGPDPAHQPGGGNRNGTPAPVVTAGRIDGRVVRVRGSLGRRGYDAFLSVQWPVGGGRTAAVGITGTAPLPWTPQRLLVAADSLSSGGGA